MKKMLLILLIALCVSGAAAEEAFSFDDVQKTLDEAGVQTDITAVFRSLLNGEIYADADAILKSLYERLLREAGKISGLLSKTAAFVFLGALSKKIAPGGKNGRTYAFIVNVSVFSLLFGMSQSAVASAFVSIGYLRLLADRLSPMLTAFTVLMGGTRSAALITPMGAFASGIISNLLIKGGETLTGTLTFLTIMDALGGVRLTRLRELLFSVFKWLSGVCLSVFLALMTTGGLIAGAYDGTFMKGAKYLAGSLIPIVGSEIAGRMDSLVSGAQLVRNAVGVTGLIALASLSIGPALFMLASAWGLKLIGALAECAADEETMKLLDGLAKIHMCVLSLIASACAMIIILIGAAIGMIMRFSG